MLATGTSKIRVNDVSKQLETLKIKDLGVSSKFSGMRVTHSTGYGYRIDQEQMIHELLPKFCPQDAHHVRTPKGLDHDTDMREADPILPSYASRPLSYGKRLEIEQNNFQVSGRNH